ncbi:MAG: type IX secretion system outer membrane channel protein PorV [Bacteroidia bacterium]|nr:type IX secretion system outer membrane channel protein PorV [Bacteroidia bacterium]
MVTIKKIIITICQIYILWFISFDIYAQSSQTTGILGGDDRFKGRVNTITTAVPFLMIAPDSRGGGIGDAGVATTPDINSIHWNPAKYSFIKKEVGFAISFTPWLRKLVNDIYLGQVVAYKKFKNQQVVSGSLAYFSLGDITFTDINGEEIRHFNPNEFAIDIGYTRLLSKKLSGSVALKYIYSNLTGGIDVLGTSSHPGNSVAGDVSFYYQENVEIAKRNSLVACGLNISNIGTKISYTENQDKDFIPINLKIGGALTMDIDDYNVFMITSDLNKLLVPTMPEYYNEGDTTADGYVVLSGDRIVRYGMDPDVSVGAGMVQSFYDAPGVEMDANNPDDRSIFREEIREINYSIGMEYWYAKQFSIRGGYFYEHATKGNRKYFTVGLGLRLNVFGLDFAYLIPTQQRHPLENTLRFTLIFNFEGLRKEQETPE